MRDISPTSARLILVDALEVAWGTLLRQPLWLDTAHVTEADLARFHEDLLRYRPRVIQAYARSASG